MTENIQYKTLMAQWLKAKRSMITPSTYANFILIAENHLIPYFGKRRIGSITEQDIQEYIMHLYNNGRLDKKGGLTVKTIRDALVKRLSAGHDRVRYDEGAALLSMGIHSFMTLAEEAEAKERYKGIVLVRMNKVYQYLEDLNS